MVWDSSDLILAGSTALFGLAAGQTGAWVQSRRDAKTQRARDIAENERLAQQLQAQADEAAAARQSGDLLDWRARRIDAYREVSITAAALVRMTPSQAAGGPEWVNELIQAPGSQKLNETLDRLSAAVEEAKLLSDAPCRSAADQLNTAAQRAVFSTLASSRVNERIDQGEVERPEDAQTRVEWETYESLLRETWRRWSVESRNALGVPD